MNNIQKFLRELKDLNLPLGEYVIISSGPLAIRGIRECSDLDILVTKKLFDQFAKNHEVVIKDNFSGIEIGNIELLNKTSMMDDEYSVERQIAEAEMINDFPFQKLETCIHFKEKSGREKDLKDLELIKNFLNNH